MKFSRNPYWQDRKDCIIFDENAHHGKLVALSTKNKIKEFCIASICHVFIHLNNLTQPK